MACLLRKLYSVEFCCLLFVSIEETPLPIVLQDKRLPTGTTALLKLEGNVKKRFPIPLSKWNAYEGCAIKMHLTPSLSFFWNVLTCSERYRGVPRTPTFQFDPDFLEPYSVSTVNAVLNDLLLNVNSLQNIAALFSALTLVTCMSFWQSKRL